MTNMKSTKKALITSALCLLLCVSMLVGATFAWFTDSVSSAKNTIVAGNLDVELEWSADGNTWTPVAGAANIFDPNALWEPGHTEVVYLKVSNLGTLALKYNLMVNVYGETAGTNVAGKEFKLSDYLVFKAIEMPDALATLDNREAAQLASGSAMGLKDYNGETTALEANGVDYVALIVYMPETVGNEANYRGDAVPTIELGVNLFATQYTYEEDSYGPDYDEGALPVVVYTAADLAAALTSDEEIISVILGNDIDLPISSLGTITGGSGEYKLGGENTEAITIDLNGNKLNITTTYWSNLGAKNDDAVFTIKNGSMTSSQPTGTWNSYDLTFSNCQYVFENVVFEKAVALESGATLKNVTINETHDYYALWICANGQTVSIDGLTVNSLGRGIKIDEQYVGTPAKVALSVSNATFNTANKAAIMVKSAAGADIALNNVNISGVAADPFNAVWVDEDAASYASLVTVDGGSVIVEGGAEAPIANSVAAGTTVNMSNVITAGAQTVINNEGIINLSGTPNLNGGDVVVNGGTIVTTSANYTGLQHAGEVTYNNVTFNGSTFLYGDKVVFNNCTFNLTTNYVWTYGAAEVEFNNCTFNTNGKAILVYKEAGVFTGVVTINGCTFNATASGFAGAIPTQPCAAVEIDSSLINGTYTVNFVGENVVDEDFSGLVRIKSGSDKGNVTINGATPVVLP